MDVAAAGEALGRPLLDAVLRGFAVWLTYPACPASRDCPACAPTLTCAPCEACVVEQPAATAWWALCLATFLAGVGLGLQLRGRGAASSAADRSPRVRDTEVVALEDAARAQVLALRKRHAR